MVASELGLTEYTYSHFHPLGGDLSPADVYNFAMDEEMREIVAFGPNRELSRMVTTQPLNADDTRAFRDLFRSQSNYRNDLHPPWDEFISTSLYSDRYTFTRHGGTFLP